MITPYFVYSSDRDQITVISMIECLVGGVGLQSLIGLAVLEILN